MACCGKKRAEATRESRVRRQAESGPSAGSAPRPVRSSVPSFQYLGKTGLTVMGPRSGKSYRFDRPGAVVAVDPVDSRALAAVTMLKRMRG
jgi:hypothetical protein